MLGDFRKELREWREDAVFEYQTFYGSRIHIILEFFIVKTLQ